MYKIFTLLFLYLFSSQINAQIIGTVTNTQNIPLPYVSVYFENTSIGTSTNQEGIYEFSVHKKGRHMLVFQYLGFKTIKKEIEISTFPYVLNVSLSEENIQLNEVTINSKENPAHRIIRKTIENRKNHLSKIKAYTSDFYSKGIFRIKNAPEKILGRKLGDFGGGLDSTRSGVIYLSETVSNISFQQPNLFKEHIIASKVSGRDNGFSFNQASEVNFNFYENTIEFGNKVISPIATYAFNYYNYKLEGTFYEGNHLINKILVSPKLKTDNAFTGTLYIVEDDWAIYGLNLNVSGPQMGLPMVDNLNLKQTYAYHESKDYWAVISQLIDFKFGMFGINVDGQFTATYNNYNFNPAFKPKEFTKEVLSFADNSNKKDSVFWSTSRPVILTSEEITDYKKKDSIQIIKKSKTYLDSIDDKNNKFKFSNLVFGYTYRNSFKDYTLRFTSAIAKTGFNTVQGFNPSMDISFSKNDEEKASRFYAITKFNYGFSDEKFRMNGTVNYLFNSISKPYLEISGGQKITQFNENEPISPLQNTFNTLAFENNFAKFYDKTFASIHFSEEIWNGFRMGGTFGFEERLPLLNTTNYVMFNNKNKIYTSNDPQNPSNYLTHSFDKHQVFTFVANARIRFGQRYISHPNRKFDITTTDYPTISLHFSQNFAASQNKYNFSEISTRIQQKIDFGNKGNFSFNAIAGTFFNGSEISFVDFKHFNGNRTLFVAPNIASNSFKLMPYYSFSTNKSYAEFHAEHQFNNYILGKIPLINQLGLELIMGSNVLITKENKPYSEVSIGLDKIGFGKYRLLRIDYVKSFHNGNIKNGVVLGIKF
ncbi:MAG: DUF5686 and carboxypeptidase regulatory-like domain-containing protein [Flavobacteriaceae bacterium]|nr:DUF5686 and carboxypeptidase regulatory-like domain-containing protein [Flavobacteriaceae bacterium]